MQIVIVLFIIVGIVYFLTRKKIKDKPDLDSNLSTKSNEELFTITSKNASDNTTNFSINFNEREFIKRYKEGNLGKSTGHYEQSIEDIAGFYGSTLYSLNKEYCVVFCDGYFNNDKWVKGNIALIKGKSLLYKKKLHRPNDCSVNDNGIVICCNWKNSDKLISEFFVFDVSGNQIFYKKTSANLAGCAISNNSKIALFQTYSSDTEDGDKLFLVDIEQSKIISTVSNFFYAFNSAIIDTENRRLKFLDNKGFVFETDFSGNQTNKDEYENEILMRGSIYDKLNIYHDKPDEIKLHDENYLELLIIALNDDTAYSSEKDILYRQIGDYHNANGNILKTIENWERAIQLNPKAGVKRKLDLLKKKM